MLSMLFNTIYRLKQFNLFLHIQDFFAILFFAVLRGIKLAISS